MKETVKATTMLSFLKKEWEYTQRLIKGYGNNDERAQTHCDMCIGMKELIEATICTPVNLRLDGKVSIGLDDKEAII